VDAVEKPLRALLCHCLDTLAVINGEYMDSFVLVLQQEFDTSTCDFPLALNYVVKMGPL